MQMTREEGREEWVSRSKRENQTLFSELNVLLRALERYFDTANLTFSENISGKNFSDELLTVRDTILRVLGVLEAVIPESNKNAYWFQKYAETKYLSVRKIDAFREDLYKQDSPEKGIYLLYDSFINMKGLITDLLRSGNISYLAFSNIGNLISKEIRENIFFNPFAKDLNPEFDLIDNTTISGIVKSLTDREEKKQISVIYIYLFRLSRILGFVEITTQRAVSLHSSLMILVLLRSEITTFRSIIEKSIKKMKNSELQSLLQAISYQFAIETKRVYLQELKDINRRKKYVHFRGKIENSHGILKNLTDHSIVQITQFYNPGINGEDIFPSFMTTFEQSRRLREDIFALHKFITLLGKKSGTPQERLKVFESLKNYMLYFESFTFRLLRYEDYEEFVLFFTELNSIKKELVLETGFHKIMEKIRHFDVFLETTLRHLGHRAELAGSDVDMERIKNLINQYL
ncbi:MAG: hypothetical protein H6Q94_304 [Nitrospirae bacterium]|nr:hypothetical protein [Nitrospirota bacterium]